MNKNPKLNRPHQPTLNWLNAIERSMIPGTLMDTKKIRNQLKSLISMNRDLLEIIVKHRTHQDLLHDFTNMLIKYNAAVQGIVMLKPSTKAPKEFESD